MYVLTTYLHEMTIHKRRPMNESIMAKDIIRCCSSNCWCVSKNTFLFREFWVEVRAVKTQTHMDAYLPNEWNY